MSYKERQYQQREELSDEGKRLWDEMMGKEPAIRQTRRSKTVINEVIDTEETLRMRLEIKKLQQNSRIVIVDCESRQKEYVKKEQYFKANECRVVAYCHTKLIERLQRILDGSTAFEQDFPLEQDENKIFVS